MEESRSTEGTKSTLKWWIPNSFHGLPKRYVVAILCFLALYILEWMRVNFLVAVLHSYYYEESLTKSSSLYKTMMDWSLEDRSWVVLAHYLGFAIGQIPCVFLVIMISSHKLMTLSLALNSLLHMILPLTIHYDIKAVFCLVFMNGLSEAFLFPASIGILVAWVPLSEKTGITTFVFYGSYLSPMISAVFSNFLVRTLNEESIFCVAGVCGLLWCLLWSELASENPSTHRSISEKELAYLDHSVASDTKVPVTVKSIPFSIFKSVPVWAFFMAHLGYVHLCQSVFQPVYLPAFAYIFSTYYWIPYVILLPFQLGSGFIADTLINRKILTVGSTRKLFCCGAFTLCATFLAVVAIFVYLEMRITFYHFGSLILGFVVTGLFVNCMDIGSRYAGFLLAVANIFSSIIDIGFSRLLEYILTIYRDINWIFISACILSIATALIFGIFGSGEKQAWVSTTNMLPSTNTTNSKTTGVQYYPDTNAEDQAVLVTDTV